MLGAMEIRDATAADWPAMWSFMRAIIAAGETYAWDRDMAEERARSYWMHMPPLPAGRTVVAVSTDGGDAGEILGTAEFHPNFGGPGSHTANAGFMVDPARSGRGVGRALGEYVVNEARREGYRAMQFNAVVSSNTNAIRLWKSLGFEILATVPEGFQHPRLGYIGLHIMHRML
jgi:GNAT superfamily N-acetyltransferase